MRVIRPLPELMVTPPALPVPGIILPYLDTGWGVYGQKVNRSWNSRGSICAVFRKPLAMPGVEWGRGGVG